MMREPICPKCHERHWKDEGCASEKILEVEATKLILPPGVSEDEALAVLGHPFSDENKIKTFVAVENVCPVCEERRIKQRDLMRKRRSKKK